MLRITNLVKEFSTGRKEGRRVVKAVDDLSLEVKEGELFTLLGPSGCGKTTTLRSVAGLEQPDAGEIVVGNRTFFSSERGIRVPGNRRGLGMVFQSYAIWPHMNVFKNVAFPLTVLPRKDRPSRNEISERVGRVLKVVQLDELAERPSTDLSGGQQQRLALARALVMEPPLLLLDEPLSNLDAKLREGMRFELKRLQRQLGITSVYVTHDQVEALAMSNRIAVMREGVVQQIGKPRDVYERPASKFVADFIGTSNFLDGVVASVDREVVTIDSSAGALHVPSTMELQRGSRVVVAIRPEHVGITESSHAGSNGQPRPDDLTGEVLSRAFMGEAVEHLVKVGTNTLRARCHSSVSLPEGTKITVTLPSEWLSLLRSDD